MAHRYHTSFRGLSRILDAPQAVADPRPSAAIVEAWLIARLSNILEVDPADLDPREPFASFGLDSRTALSLAGDLEAWVGRPLAPTLVWDYPNIAELSRHVAGEREHAAVGLGAAAAAGARG